MTTTSHLPSTNLSIPATQNTAPVLSFNCLYTHDLRRKAKRWQDGVLRFHTFNKRVMVYDVPRNFIGDTHWREPQEIQDGDELELEKGVLIQVGEVTGRTETDLSELLEKNKAKPIAVGEERGPRDGGSYQAATHNQLVETPKHSFEKSTSSSFAHLRPKSLNALLGRPSGAIGRAAVPAKSPAELRRQKENNHIEDGRSPKRRKIQYPESTSPSVASAQGRGTRPDYPPAKKVKNNISTNVLTLANSRQIFEERRSGQDADSSRAMTPAIESPKVARAHRSKGERRKRDSPSDYHQDLYPLPVAHTAPRQKGQAPEKARQGEVEADLQEPKARSKPKRRKSVVSGERLPNSAEPDNGPIDDRAAKDRLFEDEPRPEYLLRIASKTPRKKLMYRDLLPQKAPPTASIQPNTRLSTPETVPSLSRPVDALDDFHSAQRNRLRNRLDRRTKSAEHSIEQTHPHWDENSEDSSILPIEGLDHSTADPTPSDSLFLTPPSPKEARVKNISFPPSTGADTAKSPPLDPTPSSTQAARTLTELDALLLQHPLQRLPEPEETKATNPKSETIKAALPPRHPSRPFQRSISDLTTSKRPPAIQPQERPTTRNQMRLNANVASKRAPIPAPAPAKQARAPKPLQRSDSTVSVSQEAAADPWSREAWDIFGFEGEDKSVGTGNGVKGDWDGREDEGGEDGMGEYGMDRMMESQGWV